MFKPLLKTLPSLSGNMKLVCKLSNYSKENNTTFVGSVKEAHLTTLSHNIYDKNIIINLKNNNFEYDVKRFFSYYTDIFYNTNFKFSKINIPQLDFSKELYDTNKDFQYGCKRVSYKKSGSVCSFFTPLYIESREDIDNKYFIIRIEYKKVFSLVKYIKIPISNINEENYIADYLCRYADKIDDKVIYCSNSYKNIYYGISLLWGGFVRIEDNISANIYRQYYSINDFDSLLNHGFKRNSIMMKQIIPLAFYFDPNDLLDKNEKELYKNCEIKISGKWYDENNNIPFYDFSDNYSFFTESIYNLGYNRKFNYIATNNNIMNYSYPSLNESTSENYKYVNVISKNYNRWKLKYSDDKNPYIINLHYSFSANQNSLYMYKEFPLMYNSINSICNLITNVKYNMNYDFMTLYHSLNKQPINSPNKYLNLYNKNYIANFFNILYKQDGENQKYINIFDQKNDNIWSNVNSDGKLYYKGILYDFNKIYSENPNMDIKIDKFTIFVNPIFSYITTENYIKYYKEAKFVFPNIKENIKFDLSYLISYTDVIQNNITVQLKTDGTGEYVKYKDCQYNDNGDEKFGNTFYSVNDLSILFYKELNITSNIYNTIHKLNTQEGFRIIEVFNIQNIYSDIYKKILNLWGDKDKYNDSGMIYRENRYLSMETIYPLKDKIYFSIYPSKTKYLLIQDYELLKTTDQTRIVLYIKDEFVNIKELKDNLSVLGITNQNILNNLDKYYFINGLYDENNKILYTYPSYLRLSQIENNYGDILSEDDKNFIYVDLYNLDNIYDIYGRNLTQYYKQTINNNNVVEKYCKFLNTTHINLYCNKTYQSSFGIPLYNNDPFNTIFIKIRTFNNIIVNLNDKIEKKEGIIYNDNLNNYNNIVIRDIYKSPKDYGIDTYKELLKFIHFDEQSGLFNFTQNYYEEIIQPITKLITNSYFNGSIYQIDDCEYFNHNPKLTYYVNYTVYIDTNRVYFTFKSKYKTISSNISKDINHNKNIKYYTPILPQIYFFEICFKKNFVKLDQRLYHIILNRDNDNIFKDLYLYHLYDPKDYIGEMYYESIDLTKNSASISNIHNNNEECLVPYFNNVYEELKQSTKIYSDYFLNNIIPIYNKRFYRYNTSDIDLLVYSDYVESSDAGDETYSLLPVISDTIDNAYDFSLKYKNMENVSYDTSFNYFKEYSGMITYTYNDINYGFYVINSTFDNTKNTLNLVNENIDPINCVEYINGIDIHDFNKFSYSYLGTNYKYMIPYIHSSNIVNTLLNEVTPLIKPQNYKLKSQLIQYPNNDLYGTYSYSIYVGRKKQYIELNRYFDNIVPFIPETNIVTAYYLYYKNTDKFIENDLYTKKISYIYHKESKTIDNYSPITYFDNNNYLNTTYQYTPFEYKYYNNSKIMNLEKEIKIQLTNPASDINLDNYFTEQQYTEFENNKDKIIKIFTKYIKENSDIDNLITKDNILFLYKKYDIKFSHIYKRLYNNIKQYKLTITFTLL